MTRADPGRAGRRHRLHPSGTEPVREPVDRGKPVHLGFPRLGSVLPFINRGGCGAGRGSCWQQVDIRHPPGTPVGRLSQGERQLVEIAKALSVDAKVIIFDEPTTSLTRREADRLFGIIERLRRRGIAMIYISHCWPTSLGSATTSPCCAMVLRGGRRPPRRRCRRSGRSP